MFQDEHLAYDTLGLGGSLNHHCIALYLFDHKTKHLQYIQYHLTKTYY